MKEWLEWFEWFEWWLDKIGLDETTLDKVGIRQTGD